MNALTVALLVANLALLIAVLVVLLLRTGRGAGGDAPAAGRELRLELAAQRSELAQALASGQQQLDSRLQSVAAAQSGELARDRAAREAGEREQRELLERALAHLSDRMHRSAQSSSRSQLELLQTLQNELEKMRQGNEAKLESMRATVDEKLQGTLERRLGESFKLVSDRLEQVQKGLGEMQTLASDVGGLKRVLTNVKNRGSWGEVQLARQLEDMLTPEQYSENVAVRPHASERVEFAIRLPGREAGETPVWLPIDSKFPQEDYERLLEAQEGGEKEQVEAAGKHIERAIIAQAKLIRDKYIAPPYSTDFAIMYLPTEGLFAEVARRPGLASRLQLDYHVTVAGPTVLMSLLNSLQLGFRTLAIEKRSSEVWQVLGAAKAEFQKYGQVWAKLEKQLQTAQNTVHQAGVRTRAVERTLRSVETTGGLVPLPASDEPSLFEASDALDAPGAGAGTGDAETSGAPGNPETPDVEE